MPEFRSVALAVLSSVMMILAFPDFEFWFLAWFGLVPLFFAIDRERESFGRSFLIGWISGTLFFSGTCWWLTYSLIHYGRIPTVLAYFLLFLATGFVGIYTGLFSGVFSIVLRRLGFWGMLTAPFLWIAAEFLRHWTSGNTWNAVGYSQAFNSFVQVGALGGVPLVGFFVVLGSAVCCWYLRFLQMDSGTSGSSRFEPFVKKLTDRIWKGKNVSLANQDLLKTGILNLPLILVFGVLFILLSFYGTDASGEPFSSRAPGAHAIAIQPNVPMSGLNESKWLVLRRRQAQLAEMALENPSLGSAALRQARRDALPANLEKRTRFYEELAIESFRNGKKVVIFPESPMNFQYALDAEFRQFIKDFAQRNNVAVLFNSAEPDSRRKYGFFNSAIMVNEQGKKIVQYDKMYLVPFGEFVPLPYSLAQYVPTMVGQFSPGEEYDLLPFGDTKAGLMICYESHFPSLSRQHTLNGADVLIEMTNDGYLGDTAVLRQHLASTVFRAVETNRPVLRVTNVGVTAYIDRSGAILEEAGEYQEAVRTWSVSKSDGSQTLYVKLGDWVSWLCLVVTLGLLFLCLSKRKRLGLEK